MNTIRDLCSSRRWALWDRLRVLLERQHLRRFLRTNDGDLDAPASGLAVITYNRLNYLKDCVISLEKYHWGHARARVIVDDGSTQPGYVDFLDECRTRGVRVVRNSRNTGVAFTKNTALRCLMECDCEHLFLLEDDIMMKSKAALGQYIVWGKQRGLHHLNFALHGNSNIGKEMFYRKNEQHILCYPELLGAFSYYSRAVIDVVGYMDENFHNALEHVEHTYRIGLSGYTLPFWYFADHPLNYECFEEQPEAMSKNSVIRQGDWLGNFEKAKAYWISKHGTWLPPRPY